MIDVLMVIPEQQPASLYQGSSGALNKKQRGNVSITCNSAFPYTPHPLGRHPFNIITEEVYE